MKTNIVVTPQIAKDSRIGFNVCYNIYISLSEVCNAKGMDIVDTLQRILDAGKESGIATEDEDLFNDILDGLRYLADEALTTGDVTPFIADIDEDIRGIDVSDNVLFEDFLSRNV